MVLVTNRRLRGQGQKFFLLFLGDHLRARVTFTFLIFSMAAVSTKKYQNKHGRNKNTKMAKKISDWKRTCCWLVFFWRITPIFLSRFCRRGLRLLSAFSSCWSTNKGHQVFPSLADNRTTTDCERKEPFLSRAPAPAGRCWSCPG